MDRKCDTFCRRNPQLSNLIILPDTLLRDCKLNNYEKKTHLKLGVDELEILIFLGKMGKKLF